VRAIRSVLLWGVHVCDRIEGRGGARTRTRRAADTAQRQHAGLRSAEELNKERPTPSAREAWLAYQATIQ